MLASQVQEVGLKTYLFTYGLSFDTISISMLAEVIERSRFDSVKFFCCLLFCARFLVMLDKV
jgi:hypothetical protein